MSQNPDQRPLSERSVTPGAPWPPIEVFDRLGSTNDEVRSAPSPWRVVVAEEQDAGRGRLGRTWTTTPGTSLAVSAFVPPPASGPSWVPLLAGLAVHRAVAEVAGVHAVGEHVVDEGLLFRGEGGIGGVDIDEGHVQLFGEGAEGVVVGEEGGGFEAVLGIVLVGRLAVEFAGL